VFGAVSDPERPDLAIEVVWTSGGIDKLAIYARLGVREVWFWRRGRLTAHVLGAGEYTEVTDSQVLPGIDLVELASHLDRATASQAMREYRAAIQVRRARV
jgi:Uma2 family endonuclease